MKSIISNFLRNEEGVTMVEYGLLAALIAVVCILAITHVGQNVNAVFTSICNSLKTAINGSTTC